MQAGFQIVSEHINRPIKLFGSRRPVLNNFIVVGQAQLNRGVAQGDSGHHVGDVSHFRAHGF